MSGQVCEPLESLINPHPQLCSPPPTPPLHKAAQERASQDVGIPELRLDRSGLF